MTYGRDLDTGQYDMERLDSQVRIGIDSNTRELSEGKGTKLYLPSRVVSCPESPIMIPGITAADALDAGDCMGTIFKIQVPYSGIIYSATLWDLDDENSQINVHIFKQNITQIANDAAWSPSDSDILNLVTTLVFVPTVDHINSRVAQIKNIGMAYTAPEGIFYCQAETEATPTIASNQSPRVQLQIIPDNPYWQGR